MKYINKCSCGTDKTKSQKINFGLIPIEINFYTYSKTSKKKYVSIIVCKNCNLVQLNNPSSKFKLFNKNYSYKSGDSKEKIDNFKNLIKKIKKINKGKNISVLDVGSNDNSFVNLLNKAFPLVRGIEPTNTFLINHKKNLIYNDFLNCSLSKKIKKKDGKFDTILIINLLGHVKNITNLLKSACTLLKDNGVVVIEVQYLNSLLENNGFDSFHHEHISYFNLSSINKILNLNSLFIQEASIEKHHGGILRVIASKKNIPLNNKIKNIIAKERTINVRTFLKKLNSFRISYILALKKIIYDISSKKIIYGIGAAPRACVLINLLNLNSLQIRYIGEVKGSKKINKFVPGTDIIVKDENFLINKSPDFFIIFSWHLSKKIISNYKKIGYKGKFLIPLPNIKFL